MKSAVIFRSLTYSTSHENTDQQRAVPSNEEQLTYPSDSTHAQMNRAIRNNSTHRMLETATLIGRSLSGSRRPYNSMEAVNCAVHYNNTHRMLKNSHTHRSLPIREQALIQFDGDCWGIACAHDLGVPLELADHLCWHWAWNRRKLMGRWHIFAGSGEWAIGQVTYLCGLMGRW